MIRRSNVCLPSVSKTLLHLVVLNENVSYFPCAYFFILLQVGSTNPTVAIYVYDISTTNLIEFQLPADSISNKDPNDFVLYDLTWVSNESVSMISTNRVQNESVIIRCRLDGYCWKVSKITVVL